MRNAMIGIAIAISSAWSPGLAQTQPQQQQEEEATVDVWSVSERYSPGGPLQTADYGEDKDLAKRAYEAATQARGLNGEVLYFDVQLEHRQEKVKRQKPLRPAPPPQENNVPQAGKPGGGVSSQTAQQEREKRVAAFNKIKAEFDAKASEYRKIEQEYVRLQAEYDKLGAEYKRFNDQMDADLTQSAEAWRAYEASRRWVCNAFHHSHHDESECSKPWMGGRWEGDAYLYNFGSSLNSRCRENSNRQNSVGQRWDRIGSKRDTLYRQLAGMYEDLKILWIGVNRARPD